MMTIELFGFKASKYTAQTEIATFFQKLDPKIDGQIIFYETEPQNFKGENTKVVKIIASDSRLMKTLRRRNFLKLECFRDANVGLFHYVAVKKAELTSESD